MNLPNRLTLLRICLVPVCILLLLWEEMPHHNLLALLAFAVAALTDLFDGKIARNRNLVTNFGKLLDPLADKVLVTSVLMCFVELDLASSVVVIIIVAREFLVTSLRLVAMESGKVIAASYWGKVKTVTQMLAIVVVLCIQELLVLFPVLSTSSIVWIGDLLLWLSAVATLVSGVNYLWQNRECIGRAS